MTNTSSTITESMIYDRLKTVMDPELNINIVELGLIYDVSVGTVKNAEGERQRIHIVMTLTTTGCPLAGVFDRMVRESLQNFPGIDIEKDVTVELTFDPPWIVDMMSEEARAELGI